MYYDLIEQNKSIIEAYEKMLQKKLTEDDETGGDGSAYNKYLLATTGDLPKSKEEYMKVVEESEIDEDFDKPSTEYLDLTEEKVTLNKPFRTPDAAKKFAVYVKNSEGRVVIVRFGDPESEIRRDDPERRKSFRARHSCDTAKDKTTPRYWSCRFWESGTSVSDLLK